MVASSQRAATRVGVNLLARGATAADAAVGVAAALSVCEPNSTGLGGDCFALYYEAESGRVTALNGSGRAPGELTLARLARDGIEGAIPRRHGHAITVPGGVAGWGALHRAYGRLRWSEILSPAIDLARGGFEVGEVTAHFWARGLEDLRAAPGGEELTLSGRAPRAGEIFRNPGLAGTLESLAEDGPDALYHGPIARDIAAAARAAGGALSERDLARHASTWEEPISLEYRGYRVWECPPSGQGLAALLALGILRGTDLAATPPLSGERLHHLTEALRLAFADARYYVADPAAVTVPVNELLSERYLAERRSAIDPRRRAAAPRGAPRAGGGTVQFCVVDGSGAACSAVQSNYMGFGTGAVPPGRGFSLQNRGCDFSLDPDHPNALSPEKRPYHTIIPGMLTRADGSLYGPFGVMGGFMQPQGHAQVVCAMVDDGAGPQAALDRPRICLEPAGADARVLCEEGIPREAAADLAARGHEVRSGIAGFDRAVFGRGQIIRRDPDGTLVGGSDRRADGCADAAP